MKKLGGLSLLLLLAAGVWVNSLRPAPNVKARSFGDYEVEQRFNWDDLIGYKNVENKGAFNYYQGSSSHNQHNPRDLVLFLPSAGREASDFIELFRTVEQTGHSVEVVDFPSLKQSIIPDTLKEYSMIFAPAFLLEKEKIFIVGHAFGNRVARMAAHQNPENIKGVILLAAGGQVPPDPEADAALKRVFNPLKSHRSRMKDVRTAFFADGNEIPPHWKRGWHTKTAIAQGKAKGDRDDSWHCAGGVPMLIVQPMQDKIAPPANAYALKEKCSQEVEIVEVQNAGHALLPEQPEAVAKAVLDFLAKHHPTDKP